MAIYQSIAQLVGGTPLVEPVNYNRKNNLEARVVVKL